MLFLFQAGLMAVLPFYRTVLPNFSWPPAIEYSHFEQGSRTSGSQIENKNPRYLRIKHILSDGKRDWKYDINTYVPVNYYRVGEVSINCSPAFIVVSIPYDNEWYMQFSRPNRMHIC